MVCIMMKFHPQVTKQRAQHGAALVAVLWISLLLSTLIAGTLTVARTEARAAHARAESLKALMAAHSGLEIAAYLMATGEANNTTELFQHIPGHLNGYALDFETSPESQKLDINLANEQILQDLFIFLGLDQTEAQGLAARIADWRDSDNLARPNGAERNDYINVRNKEKIGNRPFHSTKELLQVLNFPPDLYDCIAPAITVLGTSAAPTSQLMVQLYGDTPFADQSNRTRRLSTSSRAQSGGARIAVTVIAHSNQGRYLSLNGLFRITGDSKNPYESIAVFPDTGVMHNTELNCQLANSQ